MHELRGLKVAILVADGFEQSEMTEPRRALNQAGAETVLVSPEKGKVTAWKSKGWGDDFAVDKELALANPNDYDALLLPGGVINPDTLRLHEKAIAFIKHFIKTDKPIAAICHGPWTLIDADGVKGRKLTSWSSIKIDLINAGAHWVDQEVVKDRFLVTSRKPDDIPAFNRAMVEVFSQARKVGAK